MLPRMGRTFLIIMVTMGFFSALAGRSGPSVRTEGFDRESERFGGAAEQPASSQDEELDGNAIAL